MRKTIERRELFTLDKLDVVVQGTYHKPRSDRSAGAASASERNHIGILLLNGLSAVRSLKGDSAVYWADALSAQGYSLFRLDLPGLGDSEGEPAADHLSFINGGGFAPVVSKAIDELAKMFNLSSVVLLGLCSGATSAIYTAAVNRRCTGLVLLNPYFHLAQIEARFRHLLRTWVARSGLKGVLVRAYESLKQAQQGFLGTNAPDNANRQLLRCWKHLASTGLPILILTSPDRNALGVKQRTAEFDYLKHALDLAGRNNQVSIRAIEGAHHSFANRQGRAAVRQHIESWLEDCFSPAECGRREVADSGSAVWQWE